MSARKQTSSPPSKSKRSHDEKTSSHENPNETAAASPLMLLQETSSPQNSKDSSPNSNKSKKKTTPSRSSTTTGSGNSPPSLKLNHQLFSFEGKSSGRKRAKKETTTNTASPPPSASKNSANNLGSRNNNKNSSSSSWGPVYRGSIQHMVLKKINVLDEDCLQESPFLGGNNKSRSGSSSLLVAQEQPQGAMTASSRRSSSSMQAIRNIVLDIPRSKQVVHDTNAASEGAAGAIIPEVTFRTTVLPQAPAFRKGDRVIIKRGENGQPLDTGFVVEVISNSLLLVQSEETVNVRTLHASQLERIEMSSVPLEKFTPSEIRTTFWKCLCEELDHLPKRNKKRRLADEIPQIDFAKMARSCAIQAFEKVQIEDKK